jgi:hypothetical protein
MLTPAGDSAVIGLGFAAALMESETTQLAPAKGVQIALPVNSYDAGVLPHPLTTWGHRSSFR